MWIPKGAALIRGRHLFETRPLLDEIQYFINQKASSYYSFLLPGLRENRKCLLVFGGISFL